MLHAMLPTAKMDPKKGEANPCMFVDTGVPKLFRACYELGAIKKRLEVKATGAATINTAEEDDHFQIGKRNFAMLRKLLWKNGVLLKAQDVGGTQARTVSLEIGSGIVTLRVTGNDQTL